MLNRIFWFTLLACVLTACNPDSRLAELEVKLASTESALSSLQKQHDDLKLKYELLEQRVDMSQMIKDWDGIAYLTPGSTGYSVVKMELGNLTVSLADIRSYANGSKVALQFGNLSSATIDGLKAKLEWGPVSSEGTPNNKEAKTREVTFSESLSPGAWSRVEVVLEGVPPAALGFVRVRDVSHRAIRLRGR